MAHHRPPNRLAGQASPYLLQHAHNPVDWYPWGEQAFAEARRRDVPIFLSIGYSTCYWCHVMERESFENEAIAKTLNDRFVCIKVDREERPDVDDLYMAATQIMTGHGGWPMSCFLEPERLRPFWCGTYFPPEPRGGMPGFPQVLEALDAAWRSRRDEVIEQAGEVAAAVAEHLAQRRAPVAVGLEQVSDAARSLLRALDRVNGGFGAAPKFPQPVFLDLLLDVRQSAGDEATRDALDGAIRLTLDRMACGGLADHVGGGFHRYCVDAAWIVPHFEKMLYDNAQLAWTYARAAVVYGDDFYRRTAVRTLEYVLREMTSPDGAFYSAQDAEVDGREGANYIWRAEELRAALPPDQAEFALKVYGVDEGPNFRDPHHPDEQPANVLRLKDRPERIAAAMGLDTAAFLARLDAVNAALEKVRTQRPQPRLDDKTLTSWNGLMIAAMARAGTALGERRFVEAAARAADAVFQHLRDPSGDLRRSHRAGQPGPPAFLEDYAFFIDGLLALHAADAQTGWLRGGLAAPATLTQARGLCHRAIELFGDGEGGFYDTRDRQPDLFVRASTTHDGAIPSGVSAMLHNLIELHERTGDAQYLDAAIAGVRSVSGALAAAPTQAANSVRALLRLIAAGSTVAERLASLGPSPTPPDTAPSPVEVYASEDRIQVGVDRPASLMLSVRIADGYHINAADPGPGGAGLIPLRIGVTNGTGVEVYADYPEGEPYGPDGDIRVHRGQFEFRIAVERVGTWSGRPLLTLTYQACTETECLPPTTVELSVAIDPLD